jgi:hypothetical protein
LGDNCHGCDRGALRRLHRITRLFCLNGKPTVDNPLWEIRERVAEVQAPCGGRLQVPTDRRSLDNATLLPACRKPPLTPVLYFGCHRYFGRPPLPSARARSEPPGSGGNAWGLFFGNRGASIAAGPASNPFDAVSTCRARCSDDRLTPRSGYFVAAQDRSLRANRRHWQTRSHSASFLKESMVRKNINKPRTKFQY